MLYVMAHGPTECPATTASAGSARPPTVLLELWEQPNFALANRLNVPKLGLASSSSAASARADGSSTALPDPTASPDATPLASAVVTLDPSGLHAAAPGTSVAAADGVLATKANNEMMDVEVLLPGRRGLGKAFTVRFGVGISIW